LPFRLLDDWFLGLISNLGEPIEQFHLTINFMIDPPTTGGSSPFGSLLRWRKWPSSNLIAGIFRKPISGVNKDQ
jgi:hypothetical protein